tara:strand:+ start:456 stop:650 length:195 start_codon:yes stop_codon:yes gene_type:complete
MTTQSEKINRLDKEVALIKKDIQLIMNNHLAHIQQDLSRINKVLWSVGFLLFTHLVILAKDFIF